jgi:hypothetical protein
VSAKIVAQKPAGTVIPLFPPGQLVVDAVEEAATVLSVAAPPSGFAQATTAATAMSETAHLTRFTARLLSQLQFTLSLR